MNAVDLILGLAAVAVAVRGFRRGALVLVTSVLGAVGGLFVGAVYAPQAASAAVQGPGQALALATFAGLVACVLVGQTLGAALGHRLRSAVSGAGVTDRTFGMALGLVGLLVLVWLSGSVLIHGPLPGLAGQVRRSHVFVAVAEALPPPPDVLARAGAYLDQRGFPQVFSGLRGVAISPPVSPPARGAVAAAAGAGEDSTVQVQADACGGRSSGSGFVIRRGFVVTNAHVVAGGNGLTVRTVTGAYRATAVHFDPTLDLAVLSVRGLDAPALRWVGRPAERGVQGATLGFPGGRRTLIAKAATVRQRTTAVGRDIYGRQLSEREVLTLSAAVRRGDSGGPFVTREGRVAGVVFAAAAADTGTGYALTAERVRADVAAAIAARRPARTGTCRY